jgi:hypothetical protein
MDPFSAIHNINSPVAEKVYARTVSSPLPERMLILFFHNFRNKIRGSSCRARTSDSQKRARQSSVWTMP